MKCSKCAHENEQNSKFCSNCGETLAQKLIEQKGIPMWAVVIGIVCCLTLGWIGYGFWDYYKNEDSTFSETVSDEKNVKQMTTDVVDEKRAEVDAKTDRIAIIKDAQQKVFTVFTSNSLGSGFLYKKGGYIVTNAHVVDGEVNVTVKNVSGQESAATVIGISDEYDIALLYAADYKNAEPLLVELKESAVGLEVIALGSPQGFENSASVGYITGMGRDFEHENFVYKKIYQVDAQIDQGSSGGPLVDAQTGKVIGINSLVYTSETATNFAFSIPLYSMLEQFDRWAEHPMNEREVLQVAGVYDDYSYEEQPADSLETDLASAGQFVQSFRMYYERALNEGDFYWIADMLKEDGSAYNELENYVAEISRYNHTFEFLNNEVLDVTYDSGKYFVEMNEVFDFYSEDGEYEHFDRNKTYTVVLDQQGAFKISNIVIYE